MNITMDKNELLTLLRTNRAEYIKESEEKLLKWRQDMINWLDKMNLWVQNETGDYNTKPNEPSSPIHEISYLNRYDQLIEMISNHKDESILLTEIIIK